MTQRLEDLKAALADRYEIEREIGQGGMANVYLAHDLRHSRDVAVKVLRPELAAAIGTDRFLKEIEIAAGLNHPHILMLIDSGEKDGLLYYVMPFVEGESLRGMMERRGPMPFDESLPLINEVAGALSYAHGKGIVHRDIKPENILLSHSHAIVADFGIAKALSTAGGQKLTRTGFPLGTPGYMSPEQAAGMTDLDLRTDIYSLACVMYEMLTGATPRTWPADATARKFEDVPPEHRPLLDRLPSNVEECLVRALALKAEARPSSVADFATSLTERKVPLAYSPTQVKDIVRRAAEDQAASPTTDAALTVGAVEEIGREVGLSPGRIRNAIKENEVRSVPSAPNPFLGAPYIAAVECIAEGEISKEEFAEIVNEIRATLGLRLGGLVSTLGKSYSWVSKPRGSSWQVGGLDELVSRLDSQLGAAKPATAMVAFHETPEIMLRAVSRDGQTRLTLEKKLNAQAWGWFGGMIGGFGVGGAGALIPVAAINGAPVLGTVAGIALLAGSWLGARNLYGRSHKKEIEPLRALAGRIRDYIEGDRE